MTEGIKLPKLHVGIQSLHDATGALQKEWIVTNGLGGFASSTVLDVNTRKYHGLLIAAFNPPVDRRVLLSKLDETIVIDGESHPIGSNEFQHGVYPGVCPFLSHFSMGPFPSHRYDVHAVQFQKTVFMVHERNVTVVRYRVLNPSEKKITIHIAPLVNSRHFHSVTRSEHLAWKFVQKSFGRGVILEPSIQLSSLLLYSSSGRYVAGTGKWVKDVYFRADACRGDSCLDDEFQPGFFEVDVGAKTKARFHIVAAAGKDEQEARATFSSISAMDFKKCDAVYGLELERQQNLLRNFRKRYGETPVEDWLKWILLATDAFIVKRRSTNTKSVIAGYPWFEDWGRDALISLPGLTLVTGRFDDAREILLTFTRYCTEGLIPNRFPDFAGDKPVYNTVDAALWYVNAVLSYLKYTGDFNFVQEELWDALKAVLDHHLRGTLYGIHVDTDGLLAHGPQLTWMDVKIGDRFVTPRAGKAVEIQALWYHALKTVEFLARTFHEKGTAEKCSFMAETAKRSFLAKFWNPAKDCLFDVVQGEERDSSLRPNQVIALMLDFSMLDAQRSQKIVQVVWNRLWGPYGLKTLPEDDPRYVGVYRGDRAHRDEAYHSGTVWPWLLGPFITAFLKAHQHDSHWRNLAFETFLQPLFLGEVFQAGLGTVSEIFDGDPPHMSRGCPAQAWSVAEPLRAYVEDVLMQRPPYEQRLGAAVTT